MEKTNGSITSEYMGGTKEEFLFTYSEEEKLQNEVNKNNAGLIFYADFYPRYNSLLRLDTTLEEDIILSFLYYWTKNGKYIYVKNEDLALLIKSSVKTASRVIQNLLDKGYIDMKMKRIVGAGTDRKMKINVDMIKFLISNTNSDHTEVILTSQTGQIDLSDKSNGPVIKEYIKKNNKNTISSEGESKKNSGTTELIVRLKDYQLSPDIINLIHEFDKCKKGQKISKMNDIQLGIWVKKLKKFGLDNDEGMKRVIENSMANGWQGIFELKGDDKKIAQNSKEPETDMDYIELYHKYYLEYKEKELKEKWGDDKYYEIRRLWLEWCASK